jgi:cytochrome c-type biogenesis protein CcmH
MHRDVMALVAGGYSAQEIIDAFVGTYGEKVLMAPTKEGFNLAAYVAPFAALGAGAVIVSALIRRWGRAPAAAPATPAIDATPDELRRLDAAVRDDA